MVRPEDDTPVGDVPRPPGHESWYLKAAPVLAAVLRIPNPDKASRKLCPLPAEQPQSRADASPIHRTRLGEVITAFNVGTLPPLESYPRSEHTAAPNQTNIFNLTQVTHLPPLGFNKKSPVSPDVPWQTTPFIDLPPLDDAKRWGYFSTDPELVRAAASQSQAHYDAAVKREAIFARKQYRLRGELEKKTQRVVVYTPPPLQSSFVFAGSEHSLAVSQRRNEMFEEKKTLLEERLAVRDREREMRLVMASVEGTGAYRRALPNDNCARGAKWLKTLVHAVFIEKFREPLVMHRSCCTLRKLLLPLFYRLKQTSKRNHRIATIKLAMKGEDIDQHTKQLFASEVFAGWPPAALKVIADGLQTKLCFEEDYLCYEGEPGMLVYICRGAVDVVIKERVTERTGRVRSQKATVDTMGAGTVFGEFSMFTDLPMIASLCASEPCLVLIVSLQCFRSALEVLPEEDVRELAAEAGNRHKALLRRTFKMRVDKVVGNDLLKHLDHALVERLLESMVPEVLLSGSVVYKAGEKPMGCYIVARGAVQLLRNDSSVDEAKGGGQLFGEDELVFSELRRTTAVVVKPTELWRIDKDTFNDTLLLSPKDLLAFRNLRNSREAHLMWKNPLSSDFVNMHVGAQLGAVSPKLRRAFAASVRPLIFSTGEIVAQRGHLASSIYLLIAGEIEGGGTTLRPVSLLGLDEVANSARHETTWRAVRRCYGWSMGSTTFRRILEPTPVRRRRRVAGRFKVTAMLMQKPQPAPVQSRDVTSRSSAECSQSESEAVPEKPQPSEKERSLLALIEKTAHFRPTHKAELLSLLTDDEE
eukprot:Sspe_Gene.9082::Locus_3060_Transcript_1_1_Confidence_1.000_Length_2486::g.9082::m.9082